MKSTQSGTNGLLSKIKSLMSNIFKNCKCESLLIALGLLEIFYVEKIATIHQHIVIYFSESRCSGIAGYASIIIGIYVTVWSIFATSASKINAELLKKKVEGQLFFVISIGLIEAFITTILCIFFPNSIAFYSDLIMILTALTSVSFIKLIFIVMRITKLNIKYIVQEIDEKNTQCTDAKVKLDEIYHHTINQ